MTDISTDKENKYVLGLFSKPYVSRPNALTAGGLVTVAVLAWSFLDDIVVGPRKDILCNQIQNDFTQAALDIQNLPSLPTYEGKNISVEIEVPVSHAEIGSIMPWYSPVCRIELGLK